jgi:hypothetical protein
MRDFLHALRAALDEFRRVYRRRQWLRTRRNDTFLPF